MSDLVSTPTADKTGGDVQIISTVRNDIGESYIYRQGDGPIRQIKTWRDGDTLMYEDKAL